MNIEDATDIIIEALEVFLNHILYIREIYPTQIFKKRRVYNTPVYVSIYPPLNTYLYKILQTARELSRHKELHRLEVHFYTDYSSSVVIHERYNFQLSNFDVEKATSTEVQQKFEDRFLLDFEEQLRTALYKLAERVKPLQKLQSDTKFKVLLHTTQAAFVRLSHNSNYQDFPWLHEAIRGEPDRPQIALLPLAKVDSVGVQITAEIS